MTVVRTELRAIEEALRRALPPLTIYTDSSAVADGFKEGAQWCCNAGRDGADIWRRIWARVEEFGTLQILKVKAHTTAKDVQEGLIEPMRQAGNSAADVFAVLARKKAEQESPTVAYYRHYYRARAWYKHVLASVACWKEDVEVAEQVNVQTLAEAEPFPGQAQAQVGTKLRHELWSLGEDCVCRICGLKVGLSSARAMRRSACKGPVHVRILRNMGVRPASTDQSACTSEEMLAAGAKPLGGAEPAVGVSALSSFGEEVPPPASTVHSTTASVIKESNSGHLLVTRGRLTWCDRCGRWAFDRLSLGLLRRCRGNVDTVSGSYRIRRQRMREGKHPLTSALL